MNTRIGLLVYVDLNPDLESKEAAKQALADVGHLLDQAYGDYNPIVGYASDDDQPPNRPRGIGVTQEIPPPAEVERQMVHLPVAGAAPSNTGAITVADLTMTYNHTEGTVQP